jgi:hypothetical protein
MVPRTPYGVPDFDLPADSRSLPPPNGVDSHLITFPVAARCLPPAIFCQPLRAESHAGLEKGKRGLVSFCTRSIIPTAGQHMSPRQGFWALYLKLMGSRPWLHHAAPFGAESQRARCHAPDDAKSQVAGPGSGSTKICQRFTP